MCIEHRFLKRQISLRIVGYFFFEKYIFGHSLVTYVHSKFTNE